MGTEKILDRTSAAEKIAALHGDGRTVVFTNGCFDILHPGHVTYLHAARMMGDALVVGLNSDASVRRIKGEKRPIMNESERAVLLSYLEMTDIIVLFEEETPYELIKALKPDVLVKGGDWSVDAIVGRDLVEASGGRVVNIPLVEGKSTTGVIERILQTHD